MNKIPKFKWHVPPHLIHVLIWLFIYLVPIVIVPDKFQNFHYWILVPLFAVVVAFYANYSFLIPKFLYNKRVVIYIFANLIIFSSLHYFVAFFESRAIEPGGFQRPPEPDIPFLWLIQTIVWLIFVCGVAIAVRSTSMWFKSKDVMQELEIEQMRSELLFLKSQIYPHFLFNTLNNILTLIDENKELAKQSVMQLSKLLRFILYDSQADTITIKRETEFLINYSNLMRLRYGEDLNFKLEVNLLEPEAPIAPLLLIPLLENIFKHGIGASVKDSFIHIKIVSDIKKICFESSNTYFPKTSQDKSGSGIGMLNVQKRLDLLYEKRYFYDCKILGDNYIIKLELQHEALS